jgi:hypothetical protein
MRGKGEVLVISDGTGFSYGSYCLIGWEEGEGTLQGRFCFGGEGR